MRWLHGRLCMTSTRVRLASFATGLSQQQVEQMSAMPPEAEVSSKPSGSGTDASYESTI
jgi:hypothetical protein